MPVNRVAKVWILVVILCFSRHTYAGVGPNQKTATWLACHRRAFEFFGGLPLKMIIDYVPWHIIRIMWPAGLCGP